MSAEFTMGKVVVTGGAGFIGSQLVRRLLPLSRTITVIDDCSTGSRDAVSVSDKLNFIEASYIDEQLLDEVLPGTDYVFHVACSNLIQSMEHMDRDFHVNLYGGYLLLHHVKEKCPDLRRFVYTSTASVYGNASVLPTPETEYYTALPYSASKLAMEHYCHVFHRLNFVPATVLRLTNVFGPGQLTSNPYCGVIAKFFEAAEEGRPLEIYGDGEQTRDFTYIGDVVDAIIAASLRKETLGGVFNVGTATETTVLQLAQLIKRITGSPSPLLHQPHRPIDVVRRRSLDGTRLKHAIGWTPKVSLEDGLHLTHLWRKGGDLFANPSRYD